jgi:16S rRNA (cytosine967-C5)-methyltransferase
MSPVSATVPSPISTRAIAADMLQRVLDRAIPLDEIEASHTPFIKLERRDRAFIHLTILTVLRRLGQIDDIIQRCLTAGRAPEIRIQHLLRLAVAEILFLQVPPHAAVDEAVTLVKTLDLAPLSGFVNAVLRRVVREGEAWLKAQNVDRLNTPDWLWQRWLNIYGANTAEQISAAHREEPPLDISVKNDPERWAQRLEGKLLPTGSIRLAGRPRVRQLAGYDKGAWWVQDAAAALPVQMLLNALPARGKGARVIDLCAAPGGKTAQLAAAGAQVIAVDRSSSRLKVLQQNLDRLKIADHVTVHQADARQMTVETPVDAVLLDAPCTATGTLRRHPEIAYLRRPEDINRAAEIQASMISAAVKLLRPGGILVYAVCSLEPEEGQNHFFSSGLPSGLIPAPLNPGEVPALAEFIDSTPDDQAGAGSSLRTLPCHWPQHGGLDGFYAVRLQRA